jgi:hypothetical protein
MATLPPGVSVHIGGHVYVDECPNDLCPTAYLPPVAAGSATAKKSATAPPAPGNNEPA